MDHCFERGRRYDFRKNKETDKVQKASETDKDQQLKATVVNGTSSQIMADYMKFYHLL